MNKPFLRVRVKGEGKSLFTLTAGKKHSKIETNKEGAFFMTNAERTRAYNRWYREAHKEQINKRHREWCRNNRDKCNEYRRRFLEKEAKTGQ